MDLRDAPSNVKNIVDVRYRFWYTSGMRRKEPIGIRLDAEEREALATAAASDHRSLSALARKIITEWLRANGWMEIEK